MGLVSDRLDKMITEVSSPDQQMSATISERDRVELRMRPGAYQRYDERGLAHQLGRLASLAWVEYRRGYLRVVSEATGQPAGDNQTEHDSRRREFQRARAEVSAVGASPSGHIRVVSQGLVHWQVTIRDGALRQLDEERLLAEISTAVQALLTDYYLKMVRLKDEFFDLRLQEGHR